MSVPIRFNSQANEQSCDTDNDRSSCGDAQFVGFPPSVLSPSGKMVAVKSYQSQSIEFLDATTGEVASRMHFVDDMEIAFSPDEDQAAFMSESFITIHDIMYRDNGVSFDFRPRKDVQIGKVAFKTCNDPVVYTILRDYSGLLLVVSRRFQMHVFFRLEGLGILARFSSTQRFDRRPHASVSLRCILLMESQHYPVLPCPL